MKSKVLWPLALLLVASFAGCARKPSPTQSPNPHTLAFSKAGVSLVVGDEWQASDIDSAHSLRPPTLVSDSGRIRVLLLPPDRAEPALVADSLRATFETDAQAVKHTFRRQELLGNKGLRILCISYLKQAAVDGRLQELQNRDYLVKNSNGRCVAINYQAKPGSNTETVHRMIQNSLTVQ